MMEVVYSLNLNDVNVVHDLNIVLDTTLFQSSFDLKGSVFFSPSVYITMSSFAKRRTTNGNTTKKFPYENKLFFDGKYEECLDFIRNTIPKLSDYDSNKENLVILGAQCLVELGLGSEMSSFLETSYKRRILLVPPSVFFVYVAYLLHNNQFKKSIKLLKDFKDKGKPMSNKEYQQWVELIICDGFINHRKYKKAIKFLKKQHRLDHKIKSDLMDKIKQKIKQDSLIKAIDDSDSDISDDSDYTHSKYQESTISDIIDTKEKEEQNQDEQDHDEDEDEDEDDRKLDMMKPTKQFPENDTNHTNKTMSRMDNIKANINYFIINIKENTTRKGIFKFIIIIIIVWIIYKIGKRNKKLINEYISDFRKLLVMSIGKSRISV